MVRESDLGDESVLEDMKDMAFVSDNQTRSSPEEPPTTHPSMSAGMHPPLVVPERNSRNGSHVSRPEGIFKIRIHKDEADRNGQVVASKDHPYHQPQATTRKTKPATNIQRHARSKSDTTSSQRAQSSQKNAICQAHFSPELVSRQDRRVMHNAQSDAGLTRLSISKSDILGQLQAVSAQRNDLLEKLCALSIEEKQLLSTIAEMQVVPQCSSPPPDYDKPISTPLCTNSSALTPAPTFSKSANTTAICQSHTRTCAKLPTLRSLSATPQSTPMGPRERTSNSSKRIPLTDKTEDSLSTFDSTPIFVADQWEASSADAHLITPSPPTAYDLLPNGTSIQIPIKFDDEPETAATEQDDNTSITPTYATFPTHTPSSRRRRRAVTPGMPNYSKVPHTVRRKAWDF